MGTHDDAPGGDGQVDVVYGMWPTSDSLVFALRSRAVELVQLREAFMTLATWGEFRRTVSPWALASTIAQLDPLSWTSLDEYREDIGETDPVVARQRWLDDLFGGVERELQDEDPLDPVSTHLSDAMEMGDWPEWLQQSQIDWMPDDVIDAYGQGVSSILNGWFLEFAQADEAEIVDAMNAHGYRCIRDDRLIVRATGFGVMHGPWLRPRKIEPPY